MEGPGKKVSLDPEDDGASKRRKLQRWQVHRSSGNGDDEDSDVEFDNEPVKKKSNYKKRLNLAIDIKEFLPTSSRTQRIMHY